ncbi:DNA mismatch repair protein MutS [Thermovibrio guaymasensis]|uniref:DNA mismatch repair protein MutS n=1 Tax=Thermovibrio guaymasensis TaxID=240167 RepID=A0A420W7W0_9BACT|nr:DNA mismatch repair protein MutS [Thermovibrio guaymasensis]RKQ63365.1 DNA mismatch repair protein MutS [Thermovibrio guaymasensis]
MSKKITPALKQYLEFKEKYKDAILMFRMGDFYEMFFEDAEIASRELEIALTSRSFGKGGERAPMCGIPHHALESYLPKLVRKGYKVAICEQLEEPKPGKKVVERGVVRVITPGTYFEDESEDRFLMAIAQKGKEFEVAWAEISSGDLFYTTASWEEVKSLISKFKPKEILIPENLNERKIKTLIPEAVIEKREELFKEGALEALREFVKETQKEFVPKLKEPKEYRGWDYAYVDPQTQRNLELLEPINEKLAGATLFNVLNRTKTGMGRRLLKFWLLHPLKKVGEIEKRLSAVEELKESFLIADEIRETLSKVYDIERLLTKITSGMANPKEIASLRNSLRNLPKIKELLKNFSSPLLAQLSKELDTLEDVYCEIERVLVENPPFSPKEGGLIKEGIHPELDQLRKVKNEAEKIIKEIEERERKRTGISSLKVGYNNVFGYYIEVSKPNLHLVPKDYIRKQTLVNAERFITPELKEFEEKVLSAKERIDKIEYQLFCQLRNFISNHATRISRTAEKIALLDVLQSLAKVAVERDYVKPQVHDGYETVIEEGKHPVLEKILDEEFIPNDTELNPKDFILIITGPNMGGKSVYLRQTALLTLMAQIGSFIPAKKAKISVADRIFSRVGAADNLSRGLSTFMMEMVETANILKNATLKSLIILDEIGRGTSTYDGMSIARAVVEYISSRIGAKTLFATHYHELTELEGKVKGVKNYHAEVQEVDGHVVFTHRILPGASEKSYGVHVAEIAGLPKEVIERAREILAELEGKRNDSELPLFSAAEPKVEYRVEKVEVLPPEVERVISEIEKIEVSTTTPLEALMLLARLKESLKGVEWKK